MAKASRKKKDQGETSDAGRRKRRKRIDEFVKEQMAQGQIRAVASTLQGVAKERVRAVLAKLDKATDDTVSSVFALLDDQTQSFFRSVKSGKFSDGATTAHIATHIGVLQRGEAKMDREGRDTWIKPLSEIGAIERIKFDSKTKAFTEGHAYKRPSNAYRISVRFLEILKAPEDKWEGKLETWAADTRLREIALLQGRSADAVARPVLQPEGAHARLIADIKSIYVPAFLPGYRVVYDDDADGARTSQEENAAMQEVELQPLGEEFIPDILLANESDGIWVIEAVCHDGEVDATKVESALKYARASSKRMVGFTTAYRFWKDAARRQSVAKNLATETFVWIQEDGGKHFRVEAAGTEPVPQIVT